MSRSIYLPFPPAPLPYDCRVCGQRRWLKFCCDAMQELVRPLHFALVDEADYLFIDQAISPYLLSLAGGPIPDRKAAVACKVPHVSHRLWHPRLLLMPSMADPVRCNVSCEATVINARHQSGSKLASACSACARCPCSRLHLPDI